jgi:hypothetical protein
LNTAWFNIETTPTSVICEPPDIEESST